MCIFSLFASSFVNRQLSFAYRRYSSKIQKYKRENKYQTDLCIFGHCQVRVTICLFRITISTILCVIKLFFFGVFKRMSVAIFFRRFWRLCDRHQFFPPSILCICVCVWQNKSKSESTSKKKLKFSAKMRKNRMFHSQTNIDNALKRQF